MEDIDNKVRKKWINASTYLSWITSAIFFWSVFAGSLQISAGNIPSKNYYGVIFIAVILCIIQWSITTRKPWSKLCFCLMVPINLVGGSAYGWFMLIMMIIYWKKMWKLLDLQIRTTDLENEEIFHKIIVDKT